MKEMKRLIALLICLVLLLTGCGKDDPYRVDTVIQIPVNPTEPAEVSTEAPTEAPAEPETEEVTEPETEPEETAAPTEAPKQSNSGGNKGNSGKPSSNKGNSNQEDPTEPTEPAETEETVTEPTESPQEPTAPEETEPVRYDISGFSPGSLEYAMADAINAVREAEGCAPLRFDTRLSAIASCRGYEISSVWSHTRPDGRSYATVLGDYGYGAGTVKELLVYVSGGADGGSLVEKWLGSDSHRESLLSSGYSAVGIGTYYAGGMTYICCLLVG